MYIILNDKYFCNGIDNSWDSPKPCSGYYKAYKNVIYLYNLLGHRVGGINCYGAIFKAFLQDDGKYFYMVGEPALIGEYESFMRCCDEAAEALKICGIEKRHEDWTKATKSA